MKVFLTGADGYIGSVLGPQLLRLGHDVVGLDTGYYREGWLYNEPGDGTGYPRVISRDLRNVAAGDLEGCDAVVHLAELSNDPLGENNPEVTFHINHAGSLRLARLARDAGIRRFVYTSSCSVYGAGTEDIVNESSATNPQTAYAKCKVMVEKDLGELAGDDFEPVFLRNATAYGASPRMRFDIVLNYLAGRAWTQKKIAMTSDGTPWRPLVHVSDICRAIVCSLDAPGADVSGEIFNVGHDGDNYQVREIAQIVGETFPGCEVTIGSSGGDNRSYRASFEKIATRLPGFECAWDARKGARQLYDLFRRIDMSPEVFEHRAFTRLQSIRYLLETRQIDDDFFWVA